MPVPVFVAVVRGRGVRITATAVPWMLTHTYSDFVPA